MQNLLSYIPVYKKVLFYSVVLIKSKFSIFPMVETHAAHLSKFMVGGLNASFQQVHLVQYFRKFHKWVKEHQ